MKVKWHALIVITAILCITGLASIALINQIDGVLFVTAMTFIAGLGGWQGKELRNKIKKLLE